MKNKTDFFIETAKGQVSRDKSGNIVLFRESAEENWTKLDQETRLNDLEKLEILKEACFGNSETFNESFTGDDLDKYLFIADTQRESEQLTEWPINAKSIYPNKLESFDWKKILKEWDLHLLFEDKNVVFIPRNFKASVNNAWNGAKLLSGIAESVKIIDLSEYDQDLKEYDGIEEFMGHKNSVFKLATAVLDTPEFNPNINQDLIPKGHNADYFLDLDLPSIEWLVPDIIPAQGLTMLGAKKKVGKTFFCYELAHAVATGKSFLGYQVPQGTVLYIDFESSKQIIQDRLKKYKQPEESLNNLIIYDSDNWQSLPLKASGRFNFISQLEILLEQHPDTKLIIIDTVKYIRTSSGRNNENLHDTQEMKLLSDFAKKHLDLTIIATNHLNKSLPDDPFDGLQGSASVAGSTDTNIVIHKVYGEDLFEDESLVLSVEGRFGISDDYVVEFEDCHWHLRYKTEDEIKERKREQFLEQSLTKAVIELVNENNGQWTGLSKELREKIGEIEGLPKIKDKDGELKQQLPNISSQKIAKDLKNQKKLYQKYLNIEYEDVKYSRSAPTKHSFYTTQEQTSIKDLSSDFEWE